MLTCYSPFRHWAPEGPVRLACLIHAASVHSEPGSNSPSLKSPMRRRSAPPPVDSIKIIKGFFSGRSPRDRSRGNHSIFKKNHVRSYCAARFPKSRRTNRRVSSRQLLYTAFPLLQAIMAIFFTVLWESHAFRRKWSRSELLDFLSFYEKKSMKPSERRLADAFTPEEARQMIKIPRISAIASHHIDFF